MGGNHDIGTGAQKRQNLTVKIRQHPLTGHFKALPRRELLRIDMRIFRVFARMVFMVHIKLRRRRIKTAAPNMNLLIPVLITGLLFVQPRQRAVMTLV